ncbi:MAG: Trk family potassium uptake protein [Clostridia bacterium]|nr:Trk family potassium uptake protein [Clostridia bacterium]
MKIKIRKFKIRPITLVALSFVLIIGIGTGLLCIPFAVRDGKPDFLTALFTATSATCVTGHSVVDVYSYFTGFGQAVILVLIQIGGLGFITFISLLLLFVKKNVTLSDKKLVMQTTGGMQRTGLKPLLKCIFIGTFSFEFIGAVLLSISFVRAAGWGYGIWYAVFTSVSAFCNAGFSLTDALGQPSLCAFATDPLVLITVSLLIIIGGTGFFVWYEIVENKHHISKYALHAKLSLATMGILLAVSWGLYMLFEWNNPSTVGDMAIGYKIVNCFFMAVTPRTAGFSSFGMSGLSDGGYLLTLVLMFIGGGSGSTAGGIKVTTFAVLVLTMITVSRRNKQVNIFKRSIEPADIHSALAIAMIYISVTILSILLICGIDSGGIAADGTAIDIKSIAFEVISAITATGLSFGITSSLTVFSKIVLIMLMYFGRIGGYALVMIFSENRKPPAVTRITEHIMVG